ncbi:Kinesin-like protein [Durusdinium trenchii]|uniref:Kinesin-like protein n=1 Tax=Durusdinium trenchii TaxID=1381693 RepID=A0ABP0SD73_9DINO
MLEVSHWRQEFEKAQAQREEFRMALEEKDRELQEERRRNSELLAEADLFQETTRAASPAAKGAERASRPATAAQPSRMTTREAPREAPRDGSKPGPVGAGRRPSPVLRSSRSAEPVPSREAATRTALANCEGCQPD